MEKPEETMFFHVFSKSAIWKHQEFLVATSVKDLDLGTFDGLLGLGLPGLSHVQQDINLEHLRS